MEKSAKAWVNKITGDIRPYLEDENIPNVSLETHDIVEIPNEVWWGIHKWDHIKRVSIPIDLFETKEVSARQFRLALIEMKLDEEFEEFVSKQDKPKKVTWEYGTRIRRNDDLMVAASEEFDIDEIFIRAKEK